MNPVDRAQVADAARNVSDRAQASAEEPDVDDVPFDRDTLIILAQAFEWFAREIESGTS